MMEILLMLFFFLVIGLFFYSFGMFINTAIKSTDDKHFFKQYIENMTNDFESLSLIYIGKNVFFFLKVILLFVSGPVIALFIALKAIVLNTMKDLKELKKS